MGEQEMQLLLKALQAPNARVLVGHLSESRLRDLALAMYPLSVEPHQLVIAQGTRTSDFYVIAEGHFNIYVSRRENNPQEDRGLVGQLGRGQCFGELALAYSCARQASVAATSQ